MEPSTQYKERVSPSEGQLLEEAYAYAEKAEGATVPPEGPNAERVVAKAWNAASDLRPADVEAQRQAIQATMNDLQDQQGQGQDSHTVEYLVHALKLQLLALQKSLVWRAFRIDYEGTPSFSELGSKDRESLDLPDSRHRQQLRDLAGTYTTHFKSVLQYYEELPQSAEVKNRTSLLRSALPVEGKDTLEKWRGAWKRRDLDFPDSVTGLVSDIKTGLEARSEWPLGQRDPQ